MLMKASLVCKIDFPFICVGICLHACSAWRGQKKASDSLELELQTIVSCHVGARNQTLILCKSNCALNH